MNTTISDSERVRDFFPEAARYLYAKSPLKQVICQLRYPAVLRIESAPPADFQEDVRHLFPIYQRSPGPTFVNIPAEMAQMFGAPGVQTNNIFLTEENDLQLALNADSLSLTSQKYIRWEHFSEYLGVSLRALNERYRPSFYSRIGLRYINHISRKELGLEGCKWSELLNKEILGEMANSYFEEHLADFRRVSRLKDQAGSILFQQGLSVANGIPDQLTFIIDSDFYTDERTDVNNAGAVIEQFHARARRVFRWAISDQLHQALEPTPCPA